MARGLISISAPIIQPVHGARQHAPRVAGNDVLNIAIAAPALCISTYLPIYISTYLPIYISTMCVSGLGCGVPAPDRDQHPLLDRASPQRAPAVAGPGPHTGATIKYFLAPENIFFLFI